MLMPDGDKTSHRAPPRCAAARRKGVARGFSIIELMLAMCIVLILVSVSVPSFSQAFRNYRRDAAAQQIVGDLRRARSDAIMSGWQYRVVGFNAGASSAYRNQYRRIGRISSASWPSDTAAAFQSSTQMAGAWVDIAALYPGVSINPDDTGSFSVSFNANGTRIESSFDPLVVTNGTATPKSVIVSIVGGIKSE